MKYIDMNTWRRKEHFYFFHGMDYPQYNICANIDVTRFLEFVRANKISFYYAMIYAATRIANGIEAFLYRIRKDGVVVHDRLHPSFTDLSENDDQFKYVTVEMKDDLLEFVQAAKVQSLSQKDYFCFDEFAGRDDFVYITCMPWVSFTNMSHTITLNRDDAIPRISWGKYFSDNNHVLLPFSVQVNHALVDGIHVGKYYTELQHYLDNLNV